MITLIPDEASGPLFRRCHTIWDPTHARFTDCSIPYICGITGVFATYVILSHLIGLVAWARPEWTVPFVAELHEQRVKPNGHVKHHRARLPSALLLTSFVGLGLQVSVALYPVVRYEAVFAVFSWAVSILTLAIRRQKTAPVSLLFLYYSILFVQIALFINQYTKLRKGGVAEILAIISTILAVALILRMPLRDPKLPTEDISPAFSTPTSALRSPEDNLTLWQFMSVTWMMPLMYVGSARQLNDEDVWTLAHEFQHEALHERFRIVRGSVFRRLLVANGIDLFLTGLFGTFELLANLSTPVLLQQLLRSMEDPEAPMSAAITYAILSMAARLIAAQADVLSLWFSRRGYERCRGELITMLSEKSLSRKMIGHENDKNADTQDESASMGKIMNLIRFDAYEVAQRFWEFQTIVTEPLNLIFCTILIWRVIGWSALIGVLAVFIAQTINGLLARALIKWETVRRLATDKKLQKISEFVEAIRHLRWYGWQEVWLNQILDARQRELRLRVITGLWNVLIGFTNSFATGIFPVAAFYGYTVLAGKPLRVDVAFPALQLFSMLEQTLRTLPDLIRVLLNASVALGRIQQFMNEPDREEAKSSPGSAGKILELREASFAWPGADMPVLQDVNLKFPVGLTVVYGEVAAGKSALLQALIGELDHLDGEFERPSEMMGYCAQAPWLQSMSIRDNILFSAPYEPARYEDVLDACALRADMPNFSDGDLSHIGENGIGLSGGQRARVALARAVYSHSPILLLDDPLAALDHQTAEAIVLKCLAGPLLKGRTTVLVTHRTELCLDLAQQIVEISNGKARVVNPQTGFFKLLSLTQSSDSTELARPQGPQEGDADPVKFTDEEFRAHGGVQFTVYWEYVKAGKLKWWGIIIFFMALYRLVYVGETWFLKSWGEAYDRPVSHLFALVSSSQDHMTRYWQDAKLSIQLLPSPKGLFAGFPSPEVNIRPWLVGFLVLAVIRSVVFMISQCFMLVIIYVAGRQMFAKVMERVSHATFRYYDVTPIGRLMNRLTGDCSTIDGNISAQFQNVARLSIAWITSIVVIASVTPIFLAFSLALTAAFVLIFLRFLPTSQSLRRLEMVSLSPLMSNFGQILYGMTTIRAFCAQKRFQDRVIAVTDTFQKMDHFYWSLQAWLMYRFDALSACSTLILTVLAIWTNVSPGLTAFVLTAAAKFVDSTHSLCRSYGQLQMDFVSVERVVEMLHLDTESPGSVDPPAWWPTLTGDIVFENVTLRYAPHLDPSLYNINLRIKAGSTTALLGRTGSGKSTLALALLATTLPESGRILIDGIDISTVSTQALRQRITFLAQDPVLFPGTMRDNLDPLSAHTDEECTLVLDKIAARHNWSLETVVEPGGLNMSQGQRQLVGLARALLRRSPIVIFDEATASIDTKTSLEVQRVLREELSGSTVVTIAHRVEAVRGADNVIILGRGRVLKEGPAEAGDLLDDE